MGEGATVALAIVTAHTEAAHVAAQQYGHSTVPAVAEELAEVGPVAAGVSTRTNICSRGRTRTPSMPLELLDPLPSRLFRSCFSPSPACPRCVTCPSVAVMALDGGAEKELRVGAGVGGFKAVSMQKLLRDTMHGFTLIAGSPKAIGIPPVISTCLSS